MKPAIRLCLLAGGLTVFAWFVHRAGPAEIWQVCTSLGWFAPLVLLPYALVYCADTLGWFFAFGSEHRPRLKFLPLYRIRWCGEAVNNVLPSAYVGGEALKVYLLHKRGVPAKDATASVVVGRTVQTLTQVMFIALGSAAFLQIAAPDSRLRKGMILALGLSVSIVVVLFWLQRHGMFSLLLQALQKIHLRIPKLESRRERLQQTDQQIIRFYQNDRRRFVQSACAYLTGWLLDTLDILLVAYLLGMPINWLQALAIEAFVGVAKVLGFFVPGALGVQESGIVLVCRWAGLSDTFSLAYAVIRRGRELVFASAGWLMLYFEEAGLKRLPERILCQTTNQT
jgi:putative membrane protein